MTTVPAHKRVFRHFLRASGYFAYRDRIWERQVSADPDQQASFDDGLSMPPPYLVTLVCGGPSQRWFSQQGEQHAAWLAATAQAEGANLSAGLNVLDYGCGCGRIARWLAATVETASGAFHGLDMQETLVEWCSAHLPGQYATVLVGRPAPLPDLSMDLIYAYSVVSHLTLRSTQALIADLARLARPGAVVLITFQDQDHDAARAGAVLAREGYAVSSRRREGFNHMSAWATRSAFAALCAPHFDVVRITPSDMVVGRQAMAVLRKPA